MTRHIPNILTCGRVGLAIDFFVVLARCEPFDPDHSPQSTLILAAALFVIAAITDALDGYLARKWAVTSAFGRVMDPFADKILVLGAFVLLAAPNFVFERAGGQLVPITGVSAWMVLVIIGRELLVTSIRGLAEQQGHAFGAGLSGKLKMVAQSLAIPAILLIMAFAPRSIDTQLLTSDAQTAVNLIALVTTIITAISVWPYISRARTIFSGPKPTDTQ